MTAILWFRRDLRLQDHPALERAAAADGAALALFVLDPALWRPSGPVRQAYLLDSLTRLNRSIGDRLLVRTGDPTEVVPRVAAEVMAHEVHVSADHGPYGSLRDHAVEDALGAAGARLVRTGSAYAVSPGRVTKPDGSPYRVFTPFARAWAAHGWRRPAGPPPDPEVWVEPGPGDAWPARPRLDGLRLPPAGEAEALHRWEALLSDGTIDRYGEDRDRPDLAGTSALSAALRWGEIHPRTLLADLGDSPGHAAFRRELAWREFYADVLHHLPGTARVGLRTDLAGAGTDEGPEADRRFAAWSQGRTGYPFVDAGMRQLRAEGWMHNRLRMVTASFLVKDLHLDWTRGARHFMRWLRDGDLASNQHGWQWVAGNGTDAAPYVRVLNPVSQGLRHDPDGDYVRRYVPELRGVAGPAAHEPWTLPAGPPEGYPHRVVDHAEERAEALRRHAAARHGARPSS